MWLQFTKMMDILRMFLIGERMGIWELHIHAMYDMMPYLAASGHNLYTKSMHVYLQQIHKLHETHPEVSRHLEFLEYRTPFSGNCSLRSIATGINAVISVNVDTVKYVGVKILTSMVQQKVLQHCFKKKIKLSHSVHQLSKSTMRQYRSIHNCCFKGSS